MIGVMSLLRDIANRRKDFEFVSDERRQKCRAAVKRGLDCILKCQFKRDGKRTVWCAQHDTKTLKPQPARSYELATLSGSESVGIVRFLMEIKNPSPQTIEAIESAVAWFQASRLEGIRVEKFKTSDGKSDRRVVADLNAVPLWARFCDLRTNEPIFCSRDGIPRKSLNEISHERRNGYSWLGEYPARLLAREYPIWKKSLTPQ
jgi:PelA/Pel-15E family pectate lyase